MRFTAAGGAMLLVLALAIDAAHAEAGVSAASSSNAATVSLPDPPGEAAAPSPDAQQSPLGASGLEEPAGAFDPVRATLGHAWRRSAPDLQTKVRRSQLAGIRVGLRDLEAHARAALEEPGATPLARAEAAVGLAPGLPAAQFALARARFAEGSLLDSAAAMEAGVRAGMDHVETRLWVDPTLYATLATACILGGLGFLLLATASVIGGLLRALAGLPGDLPVPSRLALLGCVVVLPVALGEGPYGVALALVSLAVVAPGLGRRAAVLAAGVLVFAGVHPLVDAASRATSMGIGDPVALAAASAQRGLPDRASLELLQAASEMGGDRLASETLALRQHREGDTAGADARFAPLLDARDPRLLTHAANVKLAAGQPDAAIALYEAAGRLSASPVIRVNLSQAYGSIVRLDQQDLALAEAQALGADQVAALGEVLSRAPAAATLDLPVVWDELVPRLLDESAAIALATEMRAHVAPGGLGASTAAGLAGLVVAAALGLATAFALGRLGRGLEADFYGGMAELLVAGAGDAAQRAARLKELRATQARLDRMQLALSWTIPGAAGVLGGHALLGLLGVLLVAGVASLLYLRGGLVADSMALGDGVGILAGTGALVLALLYGAITALAVAARERR